MAPIEVPAEPNAIGTVDLAEVLIDGGLVKAPCGGEKWATSEIQRTGGVAIAN